ncbi:hypothetical protein SLE2022_219160 [Rubroshorea leprosula]
MFQEKENLWAVMYVLGDAVVFNFIVQKESVAVSQWSQKCQKQRLKITKKKTLNIVLVPSIAVETLSAGHVVWANW